MFGSSTDAELRSQTFIFSGGKCGFVREGLNCLLLSAQHRNIEKPSSFPDRHSPYEFLHTGGFKLLQEATGIRLATIIQISETPETSTGN